MEVLILLLVVVCAVLWYSMRSSRETEDREGAERLIQEVRSVTADFLEAGELVFLLSREKYLGTLSLRQHTGKDGKTGYTLCMYDSGDLIRALSVFQEEFPQESFPELGAFVADYGSCYDELRDGLVYHTRSRVRMSERERQHLEEEVCRKVGAHPLAEMEPPMLIHTRNLGGY